MQITIGTTPVQLDTPSITSAEVIAIRDASANIFLGDPNVTVATDAKTDGWPYLTTDDPMVFRVPSAGLWAVVASGTATIEVLWL